MINRIKSYKDEDKIIETLNGPDDGLCKYVIVCIGEMEELACLFGKGTKNLFQLVP